jgi:hypothetical protein
MPPTLEQQQQNTNSEQSRQPPNYRQFTKTQIGDVLVLDGLGETLPIQLKHIVKH